MFVEFVCLDSSRILTEMSGKHKIQRQVLNIGFNFIRKSYDETESGHSQWCKPDMCRDRIGWD